MLFDLQIAGRSNEAKVEAAIWQVWPNVDETRQPSRSSLAFASLSILAC